MTHIYISINNKEELFTIPVVPDGLIIPEPEQHNEVYSGLSCDYSRIGTMGLRQLSWSSFFPDRYHSNYPFVDDSYTKDGWAYVSFFQRWRDKKLPFRVVIISDEEVRLNMPCTVDKFEYWIKRNKDIAYSITLTEYRFVE